ncbi:MAG: hypothetical protein IIV63_05280, partial [Clostridia bacterium]|nr:hypothetical protein [Clostridia bacterium]
SAATFKEQEPAKHNHGWLDNNGQNEWDVWTTYIQDKENTIWEAKLKVTNTTNGEKVLYDVHPIEKVGPGRTMPEKPTENKIPQDTTESQEQDAAYIDAVNKGDMEAAQRMVDKFNRGLKKTSLIIIKLLFYYITIIDLLAAR